MTLCKIGGSLLDWSDFPDRLQKFLDQLDAPAVLLVGGGGCADIVRQWDRIYNLGEEKSHHLAIHSLSLTAQLLVTLLQDASLVSNQEQLDLAIANQHIAVLEPGCWIESMEASSSVELPHHWNVTSDTIALWLAAKLGMNRLILLKSVDFPSEIGLETAAQAGLIDAGFPTMFKHLADHGHVIEFHWHNLRETA